jgi:hypothetical protein
MTQRLTCRLQEVRPRALSVPPAQMTRIVALTTLTALGLPLAQVHEPGQRCQRRQYHAPPTHGQGAPRRKRVAGPTTYSDLLFMALHAISAAMRDCLVCAGCASESTYPGILCTRQGADDLGLTRLRRAENDHLARRTRPGVARQPPWQAGVAALPDGDQVRFRLSFADRSAWSRPR